jgi:hypothetical protein
LLAPQRLSRHKKVFKHWASRKQAQRGYTTPPQAAPLTGLIFWPESHNFSYPKMIFLLENMPPLGIPVEFTPLSTLLVCILSLVA